jgi:hypothetical protein
MTDRTSAACAAGGGACASDGGYAAERGCGRMERLPGVVVEGWEPM